MRRLLSQNGKMCRRQLDLSFDHFKQWKSGTLKKGKSEQIRLMLLKGKRFKVKMSQRNAAQSEHFQIVYCRKTLTSLKLKKKNNNIK